MQTILGPVLTREGGYAFDSWTFEDGIRRGYVYRRVEDAHYARNSEIRCSRNGRSNPAMACGTVEEFVRSTRVITTRGYARSNSLVLAESTPEDLHFELAGA